MPTTIGAPPSAELAIDPSFDDLAKWVVIGLPPGGFGAPGTFGLGAPGRDGTGHLAAVGGGSFGGDPIDVRTADTDWITVAEGMALMLSCWVRAPVGSASGEMAAWLTDDANNPIAVLLGTPVAFPAAWTQIAAAGLVVPAGATRLRPGLRLSVDGNSAAQFDDLSARTVASAAVVTTEDAAPSAAPYRISDKGAWDDWTFELSATHDGELVPTEDLVPSDGSIYPDEGWCPDDAGMIADRGAPIPGVVRDLVGVIVRSGGSDPASGRLIKQTTNRCSVNRVCGTRPDMAVRDAAREYREVASAVLLTGTFTYADVNDGAGDGLRTINVWALTENQGWT